MTEAMIKDLCRQAGIKFATRTYGDVTTTPLTLEAIVDVVRKATGEVARPSAIYRPTLTQDGTAWCALYGENIQEGVCGFGDTPDEAMRAFDRVWNTERTEDARASNSTR